MRLRIGACMPPKGGRTALVGVEVREGKLPDGRRGYEFVVGMVDRVQPATVEAARDRVLERLAPVTASRPCVIVDVSSPQGLALRTQLREKMPRDLHRPHAYPRDTAQNLLFSGFLRAYSEGRVRFLEGLDFRGDLDKSLLFYMGRGVSKDGVELEPEDEAMVVALGLGLTWPGHGAKATHTAALANVGSPGSAP